jgi:hypothetical protein
VKVSPNRRSGGGTKKTTIGKQTPAVGKSPETATRYKRPKMAVGEVRQEQKEHTLKRKERQKMVETARHWFAKR